MNDSLITSITTVFLTLAGVAIVATLVSRNSNTSGVIGAGGSAFTNALSSALSPVNASNQGLGSFSNLSASLN